MTVFTGVYLATAGAALQSIGTKSAPCTSEQLIQTTPVALAPYHLCNEGQLSSKDIKLVVETRCMTVNELLLIFLAECLQCYKALGFLNWCAIPNFLKKAQVVKRFPYVAIVRRETPAMRCAKLCLFGFVSCLSIDTGTEMKAIWNPSC